MADYNNFDNWLHSGGKWNAHIEHEEIQSYLNESESLLSLVIKASLVFERLIDRALKGKFIKYSQDIQKFRFSDKLTLYQAFGGNEETVDWLRKFNKFRNRFAHSLEDVPEKELIELCRQTLAEESKDSLWLKEIEGIEIVYSAVTYFSGQLVSDVADVLGIEIVGAELMADLRDT